MAADHDTVWWYGFCARLGQEAAALGDLYALLWAWLMPTAGGAALLGVGTLRFALWLAPAMLAGIAVGQRAFGGVLLQLFRRRVLDLLLLIAGLSVLLAGCALFVAA